MSDQDLITAYLSAAVADNGTITLSYPSGRSKLSYINGGATLWVGDLNTLFTENDSSAFTVSYGDSDITVTYTGSTTIPAGSRVVLNPTLRPKVGVTVVPFFFNLADVAGNGDVLTNYTPGFAFKVLGVDFAVCKAVTTGSKRADFNLEIGTTNVTGGVVSVTSAAATPAGALIAGTAVTGANTGAATDTLSIEAANVTAHAEGSGWLLVKLQNLDTANEIANR